MQGEEHGSPFNTGVNFEQTAAIFITHVHLKIPCWHNLPALRFTNLPLPKLAITLRECEDQAL